MEAAVRVLADRRHLVAEPVGAKPELTVEDAAKLLCRLSRHARLDAPDEDWVQLRDGLAMVDFAWAQAEKAGIGPEDRAAAQAARAVLLRHHGAR